MTATHASPSWMLGLTVRLLGLVGILFASLFAVALALVLGWIAIGVGAFCLVVGLTIWRPRYGLYTLVFLAVLFEPYHTDPFMAPGWFIQSNISSWTPLGFVSFSPMELLTLVIALVVFVGWVIDRRPIAPSQFTVPILLFLVLLTASVGWGVITGGSLNIALWETRALYLACLLALLTPTLLTRREHLDRVLALMCLGAVLLSLDIIWRRYTILKDVQWIDLAFAHESPIFLNMVVVLLVARLVWPATLAQRLLILIAPLLLYAQMVTERRAGWVSLDIGLILIAIFVFRMKRKVFYYLVLPLGVLYLGYLVAFWNATGPLAQPARAVRSINDPEGRDVQSNLYRVLERKNIYLNIRAKPLTGLGFGQPYTFYMALPDLSGGWPFYRYIPHNTVMWLWMKMGPLGFLTFMFVIGSAIARGVQLLRMASRLRSAPALVALVSALIMLIVYCYVDIGLTNVRVAVVLGLALGVIGAWGQVGLPAEGTVPAPTTPVPTLPQKVPARAS